MIGEIRFWGLTLSGRVWGVGDHGQSIVTSQVVSVEQDGPNIKITTLTGTVYKLGLASLTDLAAVGVELPPTANTVREWLVAMKVAQEL